MMMKLGHRSVGQWDELRVDRRAWRRRLHVREPTRPRMQQGGNRRVCATGEGEVKREGGPTARKSHTFVGVCTMKEWAW